MGRARRGDDQAGPRVSTLPPEFERLIEEVIARAQLDDAASAEVRADLRQHVIEGLGRGKTVEQLVDRFGDPETVGPLLKQARIPRSTVRSAGAADGLITSIVADLRHALRALVRAPTLALTAAIVLALGVGANTVVFTVLNELLLRPIPVEDPSALIDVWPDIDGGNSFLGISWQDFITYRAENTVLAELAAFTAQRLEMGEDGPAVVASLVSPAYFEMLGLHPSVGAMAFAADGRFGDAPTAVLAHGFWQDAFAGDPSIVGRTIRLEDTLVTVIGVGPEGFAGHFIGFPADLWLPITAAQQFVPAFDPNDRSQQPFEMIGRLREGVSADVAREALQVIAVDIERAYPETNRGHRVGVTRTTGLDHSLQGGVTAFALILTAISGLVLVIACLNVGSVLLVRAMSRDRELAVRIALGAGRTRLLRQVLTESMLLALLGAAAGVVVAVQLNEALADTLRQISVGLGLDLSIDWRVLALTATAALAASVLASLAPALHVLRKSPAGVLRARGGPTAGGARLRSFLVVAQVAVSVALVIATGLFVRALAEGGRVDPGFDPSRIASFSVALPMEAAASHGQNERDLLQALLGLTGVEGASIGSTPLLGVARSPLRIEVPGVLPPPDEDRHIVDARAVGARYFETVGIPLVSGRDFSEADELAGQRVAVISEAFRNRFWPEDDPIGRTFIAGPDEATVIGVAEDARYIVQDDTPDPLVYLSRVGGGSAGFQIVVRGVDLIAVGNEIGRIVTEIVPGHRRPRLTTPREILDDALLPQRMGALIVGAMGFAALFLAAVGLYGLIQFTVARDTHELGVRLALGGGRRDLVLVVLRKGFRLAAIGTGIGVGLALFAAPGLEIFLAGVSPSDPLTYGTVVGCFAIVSAFASWIPARRALRIEPTEALRAE